MHTRLESARAQRTGLEGRAALSSVSVALQTPNWTPPPPPRPPGWSVGAVAGRALGTLLAAAQFAAEVGVFAAVFALPLLALLLLTAPLARAIWARLPLPAAWRAARSGVLQPAPSPTTSDDA